MITYDYIFRLLWLRWRGHKRHADPHAPSQGQADVFLGALSVLRHPEDVLPRHQVQQEQYGPVGQVVLQL